VRLGGLFAAHGGRGRTQQEQTSDEKKKIGDDVFTNKFKLKKDCPMMRLIQHVIYTFKASS
jgi:hypothetical protein